MGLYLSQPELFDGAVRELANLFSVIHIGDLVNRQVEPMSHIENVEDAVRYDNLPLYVVEEDGKKEGKIGLIDLESFRNAPDPENFDVLARIFPFHLNLIKEEASKLKVKVDHKTLEASAEKGTKFLKVGFTEHLEWLKLKGVSNDTYSQLFELSLQREEELMGLIEKELLKLNNEENDLFRRKGLLGKIQKPLFKENPELQAKNLAPKALPVIINNIKSQIKKAQEEQKSILKEQQISESELVNLRSPVVNRNALHKGVDDLILENTIVEEIMGCKDVAEQLTFVVVQALVKGGEIFFFDPAYYSGGKNHCWIRY